MRSDAITARNRTNAQKSTGPRTEAGKAAVAQNARRHGATSQPDPTSVAAWTRIILNKPDLAPSDILSDDQRMAAALALAEAEVRVVSTQAALDEFERGEAPPTDVVQELQGFAVEVINEIEAGTGTVKERRSGLSILRRIAKVKFDETARGGKRHVLLKRYLREARGRRRRAFGAWVDRLKQTDVPTQQPA